MVFSVFQSGAPLGAWLLRYALVATAKISPMYGDGDDDDDDDKD